MIWDWIDWCSVCYSMCYSVTVHAWYVWRCCTMAGWQVPLSYCILRWHVTASCAWSHLQRATSRTLFTVLMHWCWEMSRLSLPTPSIALCTPLVEFRWEHACSLVVITATACPWKTWKCQTTWQLLGKVTKLTNSHGIVGGKILSGISRKRFLASCLVLPLCIIYTTLSSAHDICCSLQVLFPLFGQLDCVQQAETGQPETVSYTVW